MFSELKQRLQTSMVFFEALLTIDLMVSWSTLYQVCDCV